MVTDANTIFDADVLNHIVPHFEDPAVGAVAGKDDILIPEDRIVGKLPSSNQFYRELEQLKGLGEVRLDSLCQLLGEISAWRADIATADMASLSEDLELSLQIRRQGYKIQYEPRAVAYEPDLDTPEEVVTSNKRRLIGAIRATMKHRDFLADPAAA